MSASHQENQVLFFNTLCKVADSLVTSGDIEGFARLVAIHNLNELAFPPYYKVWMFCDFGKMYLQVGQYEKAQVQFLSALMIWEGKAGWRALPKGNEEAVAGHDIMISKGLNLCEEERPGLQGKLDGRGQRLKEQVWDALVIRFNEGLALDTPRKQEFTERQLQAISKTTKGADEKDEARSGLAAGAQVKK